jgi:hypothetical protein
LSTNLTVLFFTGRINDAIQRLSGCHNQQLKSFSFSGMNMMDTMDKFLVDPLQREGVLMSAKIGELIFLQHSGSGFCCGACESIGH